MTDQEKIEKAKKELLNLTMHLPISTYASTCGGTEEGIDWEKVSLEIERILRIFEPETTPDDDGLLTEEEIVAIDNESEKQLQNLANDNEGNFTPEDTNGIIQSGELAKLKAQRDLTKAECQKGKEEFVLHMRQYLMEYPNAPERLETLIAEFLKEK